MGPFFEEAFRALRGAGVRYVVVGGLAVVLQGHVRLTVDLDLVIELDPGNAGRAVAVLRDDLGLVPTVPVDPEAFADPAQRAEWIRDKGMMVFSMADPRDPLRRVDLFTESPWPFEEFFARADEMDVAGVSVRVASIDDLISMKRSADREKDRTDIEVLRILKAERDA